MRSWLRISSAYSAWPPTGLDTSRGRGSSRVGAAWGSDCEAGASRAERGEGTTVDPGGAKDAGAGVGTTGTGDEGDAGVGEAKEEGTGAWGMAAAGAGAGTGAEGRCGNAACRRLRRILAMISCGLFMKIASRDEMRFNCMQNRNSVTTFGAVRKYFWASGPQPLQGGLIIAIIEVYSYARKSLQA